MYDDEIYEPYYICDDCEVRNYCRDIDKEVDSRCIYNDVSDCFYYYDKEVEDIIEFSTEESNRRTQEYQKIIKQRAIEFKKKRKYKKI